MITQIVDYKYEMLVEQMSWNIEPLTTFFTMRNDIPNEGWLPILSTAVEIFCRVDHNKWINADIESLTLVPEGFMKIISLKFGYHPGITSSSSRKIKITLIT